MVAIVGVGMVIVVCNAGMKMKQKIKMWKREIYGGKE